MFLRLERIFKNREYHRSLELNDRNELTNIVIPFSGLPLASFDCLGQEKYVGMSSLTSRALLVDMLKTGTDSTNNKQFFFHLLSFYLMYETGQCWRLTFTFLFFGCVGCLSPLVFFYILFIFEIGPESGQVWMSGVDGRKNSFYFERNQERALRGLHFSLFSLERNQS